MKWRNFLIIFISALVLLLIPFSYFQSNSNETCTKKHDTTGASINETEENSGSEVGNEKATLVKP